MINASVPDATRSSSRGRILRSVGILLAAITVAIGFAFPASAAELMRVTFVRHAQSEGNTSGLIDTSTPGPDITELGEEQARAVVDTLGYNNYDAIYASTMVRTQETAQPMSDYLNLPVTVLPGLQEIEAGVFEGTPESEAASGYGQFLGAWALANQLDLRIPGSIDGNEFDARMDAALQTIYDNGDRNAIVYSHGGAIMFWTLMNVQNLTLAQKIALLQTAALDNTDYVIIEGNNEDGWTLVNWNGQEFSADRTLGAEVAVQVRTLTRQLAASAAKIIDALVSLDFGAFVQAVGEGISDAAYSFVKFGRAVTAKVISEVTDWLTPAETTSTETVSTASVAGAATVSDDVTADSDATAIAVSDSTAAEDSDDSAAPASDAVTGEATEAETESAEPTEVDSTTDATDATDPAVADATDDGDVEAVDSDEATDDSDVEAADSDEATDDSDAEAADSDEAGDDSDASADAATEKDDSAGANDADTKSAADTDTKSAADTAGKSAGDTGSESRDAA